MSEESDLDVPVRGLHMLVEVKPTDCADIGRGPTAMRKPTATRCRRVLVFLAGIVNLLSIS